MTAIHSMPTNAVRFARSARFSPTKFPTIVDTEIPMPRYRVNNIVAKLKITVCAAKASTPIEPALQSTMGISETLARERAWQVVHCGEEF